ncbi:MAG: ribosome maturation factor RimM [Gammaproteobacteria bacterium]|nr:ribosome maturation factor RimM [Gammaproteobacteria bacterium]
MSATGSRRIVIGRVTGHFGVRGWLKIQSWTEPREKIVEYRRWQLQAGDEWQERLVTAGRVHGKSIIAHVQDVDSREQAAALIGADIAISRQQLPQTGPGEYYWADLVGLRVQLMDGRELGRVKNLLATGANDVLVVQGEREHLIPFLRGRVIKDVDLDAQLMRVDWDPDF